MKTWTSSLSSCSSFSHISALTYLNRMMKSQGYWIYYFWRCCLAAPSCPTLCNPVDCSMSGFPALHHLPELAQTYVHWVDDAIQPSHPLSSILLLPSIFPSIRVFSNESALCIMWPKYWSFSVNIRPSNEHWLQEKP